MGNLSQLSEKNNMYQAMIEKGELCYTDACIDLPMIQGEGLFESVYLGECLRSGQNINGGGARIVQVKLE